jgi:hypothetical protein
MQNAAEDMATAHYLLGLAFQGGHGNLLIEALMRPVGDTWGIRSKTREDSRPDELCSPDNPIHLPLL